MKEFLNIQTWCLHEMLQLTLLGILIGVQIGPIFAVMQKGDPPSIQPILVPKNTTEGQKIRLTCLVSQGTAPFTFEWLKNDQPMGKNEEENYRLMQLDDESSVLAIDGLTTKNSGSYKCLVRNRFGVSETVVLLSVQGNREGISFEDFD